MHTICRMEQRLCEYSHALAQHFRWHKKGKVEPGDVNVIMSGKRYRVFSL